MVVSDFFRTFAANKIFRIMITNFLIIAFITLIVSVLLLVGVCVYHSVVDEYDMEDSMKEFKDTCKVSDWSIKEVTKIIEKMKDCPTIGQNVKPIKVYENVGLYGFVVGDAKGEPRFFIFNKGNNRCDYEVETLREKNKSFKTQGLKHSISIAELQAILDTALQANFKIKLEKNQEDKVYKHFRD